MTTLDIIRWLPIFSLLVAIFFIRYQYVRIGKLKNENSILRNKLEIADEHKKILSTRIAAFGSVNDPNSLFTDF